MNRTYYERHQYGNVYISLFSALQTEYQRGKKRDKSDSILLRRQKMAMPFLSRPPLLLKQRAIGEARESDIRWKSEDILKMRPIIYREEN